ncbi:MAG: glycosyltransferase family protein [Vicinamibacterales bacterium]
MSAATRALPADLAGFRGYHAGSTILVCGCGPSLTEIVAPDRFLTIGTNDVGRLFTPDYLVVLNARKQFTGDRFQYVAASRARAIFTQLDLGIPHPHIVRIRLGRRGGTDFSNPHVLHFTRNSPYVAINLAVHMGAARIGLIGVDFTPHHFFGPTGPHNLAAELTQIDREYRLLREACARQGVEIVNLSVRSRLTAFPKVSPAEFSRAPILQADPEGALKGRRVFVVNYRFLACGDVFKTGLTHAAEDLGVDHAVAEWHDAALEDQVAAFSPDLLFVVHGRKFSQRWGTRFNRFRTAVWLLDEPYEVDDTSRFSRLFQRVFVNDPGTLNRHAAAEYLPVCYDPWEHWSRVEECRPHAVGFVGGYNPARESLLTELAARGLLAYVGGGPWRDPELRRRTLAGNVPPSRTASLYRDTRIVINVFRTVHHFNRAGTAATSMNPRVYEAAACGALVVSEWRSELATLCPELPVFSNRDELVHLVERLLADPAAFDALRRACAQRLAGHTYASRLASAMRASLGLHPVTATFSRSLTSMHIQPAAAPMPAEAPVTATPAAPSIGASLTTFDLGEPWRPHGPTVLAEPDGTIRVSKLPDDQPGTEEGVVTTTPYADAVLSFDLFLDRGASLLAKVRLADPVEARSNSYHVFGTGRRAYLARHDCVLAPVSLPSAVWAPVQMTCHGEMIVVRTNGRVVASARDGVLPSGYCFVGTKGGTIRIRNLRVRPATAADVGGPRAEPPAHDVLYRASRDERPVVTIVTTVYDRVACLERCLESVNALEARHLEHVVVADYPPVASLGSIRDLVEHLDGTVDRTLAVLRTRADDWGITPAACGLSLARGRYVCFLSDDNGYLPGHFGPLVHVLERQPDIGFAYSSCLYDGRFTLNASIPRFGRIDLGQPLFRRELFDLHLNGTLPFAEAAWDWRLIERLIRRGVRYRHVNQATFVFRLERYAHLFAGA